MKIMVCGNVFGDFELLKKDADFIEADAILICGNVGIKRDSSFLDYWEGKLNISPPIYFVTGKHEDYDLVKEIAKNSGDLIPREEAFRLRTHYPRPNIYPVDSKGKTKLTATKLAGVSGTYSEKQYNEASYTARYMRKSSMDLIPENLDIMLLHNVPGKLGKQNGVDFDMEFFRFLEEKTPRYVFVGGYGFKQYSFFPYGKTTVLFLSALTRGYAIIDTSDWSCYFNNKMRKRRDMDVQSER